MKDIYLKFSNPDLRGESQDKDHLGWLEIIDWAHTIIQPRSACASTAGGHTCERVYHAPMSFTKILDVSSPLLCQHCSGGSTFAEVIIDFMRADGEGNRVKYMQINLQKVMIGRVRMLAGAGLPLEAFTLKYAAAQWKYMQQKIGGGQAGVVQTAWSLTKNDKTYYA